MKVLIDTFNVLHVTGVLPPGLAGPDVTGLAALITTSRWKSAQIAMVCDGTPPPGGSPRLPAHIHALYSGEKEADEILERLIADSTAPRHLLVVSSDRRVRRAARRRGAKDLAANAFLRLLLEDRIQDRQEKPGIHRPSALRPGEIEAWQSEFQIEEEDMEVSDQDLPDHLQLPTGPGQQAGTAGETTPSQPTDPDLSSLLPEDILEEAQAMIEGRQEPPMRPDQPAGTEPETTQDDSPRELPPIPTGDNPVPEDIIREAEEMLRELRGRDDS